MLDKTIAKNDLFASKKFLKYLRSHSAVILFLILVLSVFLRVPGLNQSLWFDEVYTTNVGTGTLNQVWKLSLGDTLPPLYFYFMHFWNRLFGDSEISVRMPSMIFSLLSILLAYYIVLRYVNRKTALLVAFFLAVSPTQIWYSQEARPYAALLFFLLLLFLSYSRLNQDCSRPLKWYLAYSFSLFFLVFSHYYALVYLLLISSLCLFKTDRIKWNIFWINTTILTYFILHLALKIRYGILNLGMAHLRSFSFSELWMLFFNWFLLGNMLWQLPFGVKTVETIFKHHSMIFIQFIFALIFLYGLMTNFKEGKNPYRLHIFVFLFALPAFLLILPLIGYPNSYIERSAYMIMPFFFMILAQGITAIRPQRLSLIILLAAIGFNAFITAKYFTAQSNLVSIRKADYKSATDYLFYKGALGENFVVLTSYMGKTIFSYYDQRRPFGSASLSDLIYLDYQEGGIHDIMKNKNIRICYLVEDIYRFNADQQAANLIKGGEFRLVGTESFKGLKIFKFYLKQS